ncbi:MAG: Gfo/Idh/MocA family oxidoreductase [Pirellulales bacterium]
MRFGLIGYGHWGVLHAAAIERSAAAQLVAIAVPSVERQGAARAAYPAAQVYPDYRQLLERADVDVVCVAVPNALHFAVGTNVLRAGKHLLLEKPVALDLGDVDRLLALARTQRKLLAVGHQYRASALWGGVRRIIEAGEIGRPLYGLFDLARVPYRLGSGGWRYDAERVGSWVFEDLLHLFDLARWYLGDQGEPLSVVARGNTRDPDHPELQDNFSCLLSFSHRSYAVVTQTLAASGLQVHVRIAGTKGTIEAGLSVGETRDAPLRFRLRYGLGADQREWPVAGPVGEVAEVSAEIERLVASICGGESPPCAGEDGRWSTLLGLAARESAIRGMEVVLADFVARPDHLDL